MTTLKQHAERWRSNEGLRLGLKQVIDSETFAHALEYWRSEQRDKKARLPDNATPVIVERMFQAETGVEKFINFLEAITQAPKPNVPLQQEWEHENKETE